jgi:hypothetical protein
MTGQPDASLAPSQQVTQRRSCVVGLERGFRCLPTLPGTDYCAKHHPDLAARRAEQASEAARQSHALFRPSSEMEAWADTIDFSTKESRERCLAEAAQLIAKGGLTAAQGNAIAALARAANTKAEQAPARRDVAVEVVRFGQEQAS